MVPNRIGIGWEVILDAMQFILAKYELVASHATLIWYNWYRLPPARMHWGLGGVGCKATFKLTPVSNYLLSQIFLDIGGCWGI